MPESVHIFHYPGVAQTAVVLSLSLSLQGTCPGYSFPKKDKKWQLNKNQGITVHLF